MVKKLAALNLCFILLFSIVVRAEEYSLLNVGGSAKVLEVIDGDSIKVKMSYTGEVALVRLAGINAAGYDNTVKYLNNTILGKTVTLSFDLYAPMHIKGRWNNMQVKYNDESLNSKLVTLGYAKLDDTYIGSNKGSLAYDEEIAKKSGQGLWDTSVKYDNHYPAAGNIIYTGDYLNINTANYAAFREYMPDLPQNVINSIISYRIQNPFNDIYEIKFVPGFTKDMFKQYRSMMTVSTNITNATEKELLTLGYISKYDVDRIIKHREKNGFKKKDDLYTYNLISNNLYNLIKDYIDLVSVTKINLTIPDVTIELNNAIVEDFVNVGLTTSQALIIIDGQKNYSYKTLGELTRLPGLYFSDYVVNRFEDNLLLDSGDYININFAGINDLLTIGLTQSEATIVYNNRRRMYSASNIPVDISNVEGKVSLYTNINKASSSELTSLGIAPEIVEEIITYRLAQPFGSINELQELFNEITYSGSYNSFGDIRSFITVH